MARSSTQAGIVVMMKTRMVMAMMTIVDDNHGNYNPNFDGNNDEVGRRHQCRSSFSWEPIG